MVSTMFLQQREEEMDRMTTSLILGVILFLGWKLFVSRKTSGSELELELDQPETEDELECRAKEIQEEELIKKIIHQLQLERKKMQKATFYCQEGFNKVWVDVWKSFLDNYPHQLLAEAAFRLAKMEPEHFSESLFPGLQEKKPPLRTVAGHPLP